MSVTLMIHVLAAGIWLGCLATEIAFEKAMAADPSVRGFVSRLHDRVDRFVEGPAFVAVAASGAMLLVGGGALGTVMIVKIALGTGAVLANVWCLGLVLARAEAARHDPSGDAWIALDRRQHLAGTVVTVLVAAATLAAWAHAAT